MNTQRPRFLRPLLVAAIAAAFGAAASGPAFAGGPNSIVVDTIDDAMDAGDGQCSLREALHNANTNTAFGGDAGECSGGSGTVTDVIVLAGGATYLLTLEGADDAGDLDVLDDPALEDGIVDLRIEASGAGAATVQQDATGERVLDVLGGQLQVADVAFVGGGVADDGGGIRNVGMLELERVAVRDNFATRGAGIHSTGELALLDCEVILNDAVIEGGGIFNGGNPLTLDGSMVRANTAINGGGIYSNAQNVSLRDGSHVNLNEATAGQGGGVAVVGGGKLRVIDSELDGNSALIWGGAIYTNSIENMEITRSDLTNNSAGSGGAVYSLNSATIMTTEAIFLGNDAGNGDGGAVRAAHVDSKGSRFEGNSASNEGGAIQTGIAATLRKTQVLDNDAVDGAGVHAQIATIEDSLFSGNLASGRGGALFVDNRLSIADSRFSLNGALNEGGALYLQAIGFSAILRSLFNNNVAQTDGGAIWTTGETLLIANATLSANAANGTGSALYVDENGNVNSANSTIAWNTGATAIAKYGSMMIGNTLLASMGEDNCVSSLDNIEFESIGGNLSDDNSCEGLDDPTDQADVDTLIAPLADNGGNTRTHRLLDGSPAIDAGDETTCNGKAIAHLDQRGAPRPAGAACDIGAHEEGSVPPQPIFADGFESP